MNHDDQDDNETEAQSFADFYDDEGDVNPTDHQVAEPSTVDETQNNLPAQNDANAVADAQQANHNQNTDAAQTQQGDQQAQTEGNADQEGVIENAPSQVEKPFVSDSRVANAEHAEQEFAKKQRGKPLKQQMVNRLAYDMTNISRVGDDDPQKVREKADQQQKQQQDDDQDDAITQSAGAIRGAMWWHKLLAAVMKVLKPLLEFLLTIGIIEKAWMLVKAAVRWVWNKIKAFGRWLWNSIRAFGSSLMQNSLVSGFVNGARNVAEGLWSSAKAGVASMKAAMGLKAFGIVKAASIAIALGGAGMATYKVAGAITAHQQPRWDSAFCNLMEQNSKAASDNTSPLASILGNNEASDWTDNGKKIFDFLVKKEGFSGAGAAGAVGNAVQESTCNPKAWNPPPSGCAGIFQWSTRLGENGDRFDAGNFCNVSDRSTWTLDNELKLTDHELNGTYHFVKTDVGHASDPVKAAAIWVDKFEGAAGQDDGKRERYAEQAYSKFNGSKISANDALLGQGASGNQAAGTAMDNNAAATNASEAAQCNGKSSDNPTGANVKDGTGSIKEQAPGGLLKWNRDDVPADVKPFIHDPTKYGLSWGSPQGWSDPGDQCVNFSVSSMHALWGAPSTIMGNGVDIAPNEANAMHGHTSGTPRAGAVVSIPGGTVESPGQWGHTFIVDHVLANGDIIICEQNMMEFGLHQGTGSDGNAPETWNYGVCTKQWYESVHAKFFAPDKGQPNWG